MPGMYDKAIFKTVLRYSSCWPLLHCLANTSNQEQSISYIICDIMYTTYTLAPSTGNAF